MTDDQKVATINAIIADQSIKVPDYLDDSVTSKVLYALGLDNKPTVVSDDELDSMAGQEIYRTVYDNGAISSGTILDAVRNSKNIPLSSDNSSAFGRGLYFADDLSASASYGVMKTNPAIMRGKINPKAKMASTGELGDIYFNNPNIRFNGVKYIDELPLVALTKGYDGWYSEFNTTNKVIINRGALTVSSKSKKITSGGSLARSWKEADDL